MDEAALAVDGRMAMPARQQRQTTGVGREVAGHASGPGRRRLCVFQQRLVFEADDTWARCLAHESGVWRLASGVWGGGARAGYT